MVRLSKPLKWYKYIRNKVGQSKHGWDIQFHLNGMRISCSFRQLVPPFALRKDDFDAQISVHVHNSIKSS